MLAFIFQKWWYFNGFMSWMFIAAR